MGSFYFWWEIGQTVLLTTLVFLLIGLTYNLASIRVRLGPEARPSSLLQVGAAAPELREREARSHRPVVLNDISRSRRVSVAAFLSPTCGACINDVPRLNALVESHSDVAFIAVIEAGDGFDFEADLVPEIQVVPDTDRLLQAAFDVKIFPHLAVIDRAGKHATQGVTELRELAPLLRTHSEHNATDGLVAIEAQPRVQQRLKPFERSHKCCSRAGSSSASCWPRPSHTW